MFFLDGCGDENGCFKTADCAAAAGTGNTMPQISIGLIRRLHGYNEEDFNTLSILQLVNAGIEEIDNLEVFADTLKELHLGGNKIRRLENLELLSKLEFLDLSSNRIDSEGLRSGFDCIPESLQTLILSGNSCADDEALLMELQDRRPGLGIVVGLEEEEEEQEQQQEEATSPATHDKDPDQVRRSADAKEEVADAKDDGDEDEEEEEEEDDEEDDEEAAALRRGPLDADTVLQAIVARKCRLQSAPGPKFSLEEALQDLEREAATVEATSRTLARAKAGGSVAPPSLGAAAAAAAAAANVSVTHGSEPRLEKMLADLRAQRQRQQQQQQDHSATLFVQGLSERAMAQRDSKFAELKKENL